MKKYIRENTLTQQEQPEFRRDERYEMQKNIINTNNNSINNSRSEHNGSCK